MSKLLACAIAATIVLAIPASSRAAEEVAAIIDKAIKAHGGAEQLAKLQAEQWHTKGTMHTMGQKLEYSADYSYQAPDQFHFEMMAEFGGQKIAITAATDGKTAWEKMGTMMREMAEKKAKAFHHNVYAMQLSRLVPLKEKDYMLTASGEETIAGKAAVGVRVSRKGHPDVTLFFDKESGLLVKMQTQAWDEFTDKDVKQETFLSDYKEKDGRKKYNKLTIKREGKTLIEEELSNQKSAEKLDPKLFAKP